MDLENESTSDTSSSSSSEMNDADFAGFLEGDVNNYGLQPYRFEPQHSLPSDLSSSDEEYYDSNDEDIENSRLTSSEWCKCGEICQVMDRIDECVCCQEVPAVTQMCLSVKEEGGIYAEQPIPKCITQHPGFAPVCLNKFVLRTAWRQYKQQYNDSYEGPEHKQFRHIAYRQLARWCWGYLGKDVRVVLPACAVMCIRAHFPPPGLEEDFIFEGFHYADE